MLQFLEALALTSALPEVTCTHLQKCEKHRWFNLPSVSFALRLIAVFSQKEFIRWKGLACKMISFLSNSGWLWRGLWRGVWVGAGQVCDMKSYKFWLLFSYEQVTPQSPAVTVTLPSWQPECRLRAVDSLHMENGTFSIYSPQNNKCAHLLIFFLVQNHPTQHENEEVTKKKFNICRNAPHLWLLSSINFNGGKLHIIDSSLRLRVKHFLHRHQNLFQLAPERPLCHAVMYISLSGLRSQMPLSVGLKKVSLRSFKQERFPKKRRSCAALLRVMNRHLWARLTSVRLCLEGNSSRTRVPSKRMRTQFNPGWSNREKNEAPGWSHYWPCTVLAAHISPPCVLRAAVGRRRILGISGRRNATAAAAFHPEVCCWMSAGSVEVGAPH